LDVGSFKVEGSKFNVQRFSVPRHGQECRSFGFSLAQFEIPASLLAFMILTAVQLQKHLRTLLILGRVSNLPTVWSNCLAGWWLGGGGALGSLLWLSLGATLVYCGGMYLNDAFDVDFDRQHRQERPIPSGAIKVIWVWLLGFALLLGGWRLLASLGSSTAWLALFLIACILVYDAIHKAVTFSPVLMAACRFFLYVVAASVAVHGVGGLAVWSGLALACYIVGLSYIARKESTKGSLQYWPALFLFVPIALALLVNAGTYRMGAMLLSLLLGAWIFQCLRHTLWRREPHFGRTVSGLLAGIVLVDWVAVVGAPFWVGLIFATLFFLALIFQHFIPAT
jgi:hypothetical protein